MPFGRVGYISKIPGGNKMMFLAEPGSEDGHILKGTIEYIMSRQMLKLGRRLHCDCKMGNSIAPLNFESFG